MQQNDSLVRGLQGNIVESPAYLTVYLALTMTVLLSLCLTLIEGVRFNAIQLETECISDIAFNSMLAEYHRELYEQYNIFGLDVSYGTDYSTRENAERHFMQYAERNMSTEDVFLSDWIYRDFLGLKPLEVEITGVSLLTDENGLVFRRQAVAAIKEDVGIGLLEDLQEWLSVVEEKDLLERNIAEEKKAADEEIEEIIEEEEEEEEEEFFEKTGVKKNVSISFDNPTEDIDRLREKGVLEYLVGNSFVLSEKYIIVDSLIGERMKREDISKGNLPVRKNAWLPEHTTQVEKWGGELLERFFFQEYLVRYMGNFMEQKEDSALQYQVEYLIAGKDNDLDNLVNVLLRICLIREVANVVYLYSDEVKCMEAELIAQALAYLCHVPDIAPVLKESLLFAWAFFESIHDVGVLLNGGRVPLIKSSETWFYNIDQMLALEIIESNFQKEGLCYEDYLRIFMTITDVDVLTERAMNMIEADIRKTPGNRNFRLDACYDKVHLRMKVKSDYGYEYEVTGQKGYY